jgi:hypothetical protein
LTKHPEKRRDLTPIIRHKFPPALKGVSVRTLTLLCLVTNVCISSTQQFEPETLCTFRTTSKWLNSGAGPATIASHWDKIGVKTSLEISCVVPLTLIFIRMTTFMDPLELKWSSQDLVDVEEKCIKCSLLLHMFPIILPSFPQEEVVN